MTHETFIGLLNVSEFCMFIYKKFVNRPHLNGNSHPNINNSCDWRSRENQKSLKLRDVPGPNLIHGGQLILSNSYVGGCCRDYLLVWREWATRLARTAGNGTHNTQKSNFGGFNTTEKATRT